MVSHSTLAKVQSIPADVWVKIGLVIVAIIAVVVVLRKVAKMNKIVLAILLLLIGSIIGFNWIYERNEPAWATPVVEKLAQFFPSKNSLK